MALILEGSIELPDWSIMVAIQPKGTRPPIFCVHGVGGEVIGYSKLADWLGPDQPVYGLRARGLYDNLEPHDRVEDMARAYLKEIQTIQPQGPYYLLGYSFGGIVAYELACQIREQGGQVALLAIVDTYALSRAKAIKILWRPKNLIRILMNIPLWLLYEREIRFPKKNRPEVPKEHRRIIQAHNRSLLNYLPKIFDGKVTLFRVRAMSLLRSFDPEFGWEELAREGVETHLVSGFHSNLLEDPHVESLAGALKLCVDRILNQS